LSAVFLDTAYAIALAVRSDAHHERAVGLAKELMEAGTRLITTRAVVLEIGNSLARQRYRLAALQILRSLEGDPRIEIIPVSEDLYQRAFQLFRSRPDKEWGITDCLSFVVMHERSLTSALTADAHFQQAGFEALLR
jgi:predicted nucleic acid-binding protein